MSSVNAEIPSHVSPELVLDFDLYNVPGVEQDYQLALKRLHDEGCPDIFWTPRNGGHWVVTRGEDMYGFFADIEHFSSNNLTVPRPAHSIHLYPIHADPPQHAAYRAIDCAGVRAESRCGTREQGARARDQARRRAQTARRLRVHRRFCAASADRSVHGHRRPAAWRSQDAAWLGRQHGATGNTGNADAHDPENFRVHEREDRRAPRPSRRRSDQPAHQGAGVRSTAHRRGVDRACVRSC